MSVEAAEQVGVDLETRDIADLKAALVGVGQADIRRVLENLIAASSTTCAVPLRRRHQHLHDRYAGRRLVPGLQLSGAGPGMGHGMGARLRPGSGSGPGMGYGRGSGMGDGAGSAQGVTAAVAERWRPPRVWEKHAMARIQGVIRCFSHLW